MILQTITASDLGTHNDLMVIVEVRFLNQTVKVAMLRKDFNRMYNTGYGVVNPETAVGCVELIENQEIPKCPIMEAVKEQFKGA